VPGVPQFDPLDPSMSGDDADPELVLVEVQKVYRELRDRYNTAKFAADPVGRRALGECLDAVGRVLERWEEAAHPLT